MNNNNIFFTGATHLNNYDYTCNFIIKEIIYTSNNLINQIIYTSNDIMNNLYITSNILLSDVIITSNNLINNINITSNILLSDIIASSNDIINQFKPLIYYKNNSTTSSIDTYIYNYNALGEIRFYTENCSPSFGASEKYLTKIAENGKLMVYISYDIANPTILLGWYDVSKTIVDNYAYQAQTNILIVAIQGEINTLNNTVGGIYLGVTSLQEQMVVVSEQVQFLNSLQFIDNTNLINEISTVEEITAHINDMSSYGYFDVFKNPAVQVYGGATAIGVAASTIGYVLYTNYIQDQVEILKHMVYSNITPSQQGILIKNMSNINISNVNNFYGSMSNLSLFQGFINQNTISTQEIPNISTQILYYNGNELSTILNTSNINNINYSSNLFLNLSNSLNSSNTNLSNALNSSNTKLSNALNSSNINVLNALNSSNTNLSNTLNSSNTKLSNALNSSNINLSNALNSSNTNLSNALNSSNTNTSNYINNLLSSTNINFTNTSNYININNSNTSNYIKNNVLNLSNLCININTNTSNFTKKTNVILPNTNFWYDGANGIFCYDLNIEQYVKSIDLGNSYKARAFRISTYVPVADWRTNFNLYIHNQYVNFPETLTIYMNNNSNIGGNSYPNDAYANGIIIGKTQNINIGYWNFVPTNYNYIRYLSYVGWDTTAIIEALN